MQEASAPFETAAAPPAPLVEAQAPARLDEQPADKADTETQQAIESTHKSNLSEEIKTVSDIIIRQQAEAFANKFAFSSEAEKKDLLKDPANRSLLALNKIHLADQANIDKKGQIELSTDQPIVITDKNSRLKTIVSITRIDGDSFYVKTTDKFNPTPIALEYPISRQDLEKAQISQNIAKNLSSFPEAQRKIVELYFKLSEKTIAPGALPKEAETQLLVAAREAGRLTFQDVEALVKIRFPDEIIPDGAKEDEIKAINEKNEKLAERRAKLVKPIKDRGILVTEPQQITTLLSELGAGEVSLSETQNKAAQEVIRLRLLLEANKGKIGKTDIIMTVDGKPKSVRLTQEIYRQWGVQRIQAETESSVCLDAIQAYKEKGPIKEDYFAGDLSLEESLLIVESFRTGEIAKPPDISTARDAQTKVRLEKANKLWQRQELLKKSTKGLATAGFSLIGLLAAMGLLAKKEHA